MPMPSSQAGKARSVSGLRLARTIRLSPAPPLTLNRRKCLHACRHPARTCPEDECACATRQHTSITVAWRLGQSVPGPSVNDAHFPQLQPGTHGVPWVAQGRQTTASCFVVLKVGLLYQAFVRACVRAASRRALTHSRPVLREGAVETERQVYANDAERNRARCKAHNCRIVSAANRWVHPA